MEEIAPKTHDELKKLEIRIGNKDKKIVTALSYHPGFSTSFIGKMIHLSKDSVRYRIKQMHKKLVLISPILILNPYSFGYQFRTLFLKLKGLNFDANSKILQFLISHPSTIWVGLIGGEWDIGTHIISKDTLNFQKVLDEIKMSLEDNLKEFLILENFSFDKYENLTGFFKDENKVNVNIGKDKSLFHNIFKPSAIPSEKVYIDSIDSNIILRLSENPLISLAELAELLKISFETAKKRILKLIKNKVILSFNYLCLLTSLGISVYIILFEFVGSEEERKKFEEYIKESQNTGYSLQALGKYNWQIYFGARNYQELYTALGEIRSKFKLNIKSYSILNTLSDLKFNFLPEEIKNQLLTIKK